MSVPESAETGRNQSLSDSLRTFWGVLVAILYARLDLATVELEEVGTHAVQVVVMSLAAIICIAMTIFFFLFFLVVFFWAQAALVLGIICIVGLLASVILVLIVRQMVLVRPKFLAQTLAELRRDVEGLRPKEKTGEIQS